MFNCLNPDNELLKSTWSMTDRGPADSYNELYPSFTYPPALLRHFGSIEVLEVFLFYWKILIFHAIIYSVKLASSSEEH